ncbi:hypothetical protein SISNIDRAFT_482652 [Sistotremastrum niveocremeum HHB9708]|uniref:Ig-like domain-containing protein n=1 Tax=Sistotremastrum niveocremeum HHB9708 TaxID=1314777 RepID=A0A164YFT9_9AGAM|nr:hypothetical protein SISNIDRAFT_482652 [Sistotremastrum niveocremeum HHB9708]
MTIASAIVFGVLTAAYTTILAPLPIVLSEPLSGWEIDFLATDASCSAWFSDNNLFSFGACGWQNLSGLGVSTCWSSGKRLEIMTAGRSASQIVKEFKQQLDQLGSPSLQEVVEIYEMGGSTFYGSTGGAVPQGPASDKHLDTTQSYSRQANSSLDQQGIDISVSCQYINESPMTAFLDQSSSMVNVTGYCPDGQGQTWLLPNSSFIVASLDCPESVSTPNLESHLLYFSNYGTGGSYEIIGNISCEVNGSITTGHLDYNSPPSAFSWNSDGSVETRDQSFRVLENSMDALIYVLETSQSEDGNLFIDAINSIYVPFVMNQTLVTGAPQLSFLSMLETMTRGVLEYEASFLRLIFTLQMLTQTSELTKTNPCTRPLTGAMQRSTYGWEMNSHALLAFLPIGISGIVLIILFAWVILRMKSSLTYFDPTSLISLAVASSSSSLRFPEGTTVDPHDEKARSTSVKFESVSAGEYQFISKPASQWKRAYAL